jgi:hypothetical protein
MPARWETRALMTEYGVLVLARYYRFRVTHPDGMDVRVPYSAGQKRGTRGYIFEAWKSSRNLDRGTEGDPGYQRWFPGAYCDAERGWEAVWWDNARALGLEVADTDEESFVTRIRYLLIRS